MLCPVSFAGDEGMRESLYFVDVSVPVDRERQREKPHPSLISLPECLAVAPTTGPAAVDALHAVDIVSTNVRSS